MKKELQKSGHMEVTPKQSEILQKHLFDLGYSWWSDKSTDINYTEKRFIYWDDYDKGLSYSQNSYALDENPPHKFEEHF